MLWNSLDDLDKEEVKIEKHASKQKSVNSFQVGKSDWILSADVYEKDGYIVVRINLPGVDMEKINISVSDDFVKVSGNSEEEELLSGKNYYVKEIRRGFFERIVRLPVKVDLEKAEADYIKGILQITVPKIESNHVNKLKVRSEIN